MSVSRFQSMLVSWLQQCLLRRAPQDDPFSYTALATALLFYLVMDVLQAAVGLSWPVASGLAAIDTTVMVLFVWLVLAVVGRSPRVVQTLTALAGTSSLLGVLALPLVHLAAGSPGGADPTAALVLGWLVLLAWSVTVQAHIFRHALSVPFGLGLVVAGLHVVAAISLVEWLYPRALGG
jgi:hypothetical protein